MSLQEYLVDKFKSWKPPEPEVLQRTKGDITLCWNQLEPFEFLSGALIYKVEKFNKMPRWIVVYRKRLSIITSGDVIKNASDRLTVESTSPLVMRESDIRWNGWKSITVNCGGKTTKTIENLEPRHPHKFRLKIILRAEAVSHLADKAIQFYGDEDAAYKKFGKFDDPDDNMESDDVSKQITSTDPKENEQVLKEEIAENESGDKSSYNLKNRKWLESQWSEETWTSTDTDGTSAVCFSMAVRCAYIKQVQSMLDERPDLVGVMNPHNGFTPLATAVRRGDMNMVRYLLSMGADVNQPSSAGQAPLHLAVYAADIAMAELLLDHGADFNARDWNNLRAEHYAVDSSDLNMVKFVLDRGGDITVEDNNGWTPLFRAVCQDASTALVEELVARGSDVDARDRAGLPLSSVARMLVGRHGRSRDSVLRLVDSNYPHEKALANFTRLTKKIYNVHSLLKLI